MEEIDNLISSDCSCTGGSHTDLSSAEHTGRLASAVTVDKCLFLGIADTAGKLSSQVRLDIKYGIIQKLLGNLDHGTQLISTDGYLAECIIRFLICTFLIHPGCRAVRSYHRNLTITGSGLDYMGKGTEDVVLLQTVHKGTLKLIRYKITALRVCTDHKGIDESSIWSLGAHCIPEVLLILLRSTTGLVVHDGTLRLLSDRSIHRSSKLTLHSVYTLLTLDFMTEVNNFCLHLFVGSGILSREDALLVAMGVKECLSSLPGLCTLSTQFINLIHCHSLFLHRKYKLLSY